MALSAFSLGPVRVRPRRVERGGETLVLAVIASAIPEFRVTDAGRFVLADEVAVRVFADDVVDEQILGGDDVAFHADDFGDVGDAAGAVAQARSMDDDVNGRADHLPDG